MILLQAIWERSSRQDGALVRRCADIGGRYCAALEIARFIGRLCDGSMHVARWAMFSGLNRAAHARDVYAPMPATYARAHIESAGSLRGGRYGSAHGPICRATIRPKPTFHMCACHMGMAHIHAAMA